jgi:hypothetical protein
VDTEICRAPRPDGLGSSPSDDEREKLSLATHWLSFQSEDGSDPSPASNSNLVLLSFWLVKPTRMHVAFRFKLGKSPSADGAGRSRLLDRFHWMPSVPVEQFQNTDIEAAARNYLVLREMYRARGRLNDALLLTLSGCWSHQWQVALVCYAAAAETLLTYSSGPGITRRLATTYACLVETQSSARDLQFQEFKALYSIRSDIMHGRTHSVLATDRLPSLESFARTIRRLWHAIIVTPPLAAALEGTDAQRQAYLDKVQLGYSPPP